MDESLLVFLVAGRRHALPVGDLERIVAAARVLPLPDAPPGIRGAVKVGAEVAPVVDLRHRFGLPSRELELSDRFLLVRHRGRLWALLAEEVEGVQAPRQPHRCGPGGPMGGPGGPGGGCGPHLGAHPGRPPPPPT